MKRTNQLIFTFFFAMCLLFPAAMRGEEVTINNIVYSYSANSNATIVGVDGELPTDLVIPRIISVNINGNSQNKEVTNISDPSPFRGHNEIKSLKINAKLSNFGRAEFAYCKNLKKVSINEFTTKSDIAENPFIGCRSLEEIEAILVPIPSSSRGAINVKGSLYVKDNVLYGQVVGNQYALLTYPAQRTSTELVVPDFVTEIASGAFADKKNLQTITVADDNVNFSVVDNALYTSNGETLLCFNTSTHEQFELPTGVKYVEDYAFAGNKIKKFSIADGNSKFSSKGGILYGQYDELVAYPLANPQKALVLDAKTCSAGAFAGESNLDYIFVGEQEFYSTYRKYLLHNIDSKTNVFFGDCYDLTKAEIEKYRPIHEKTYLAFITADPQYSYTDFSAILSIDNQLKLTNIAIQESYINVAYTTAKYTLNNDNLNITNLIPSQAYNLLFTFKTQEGYDVTMRGTYFYTTSLDVEIEKSTQSSVSIKISPDYDEFKDTYAKISNLSEANLDKNGRATLKCRPMTKQTIEIYKKLGDRQYVIASKHFTPAPINATFTAVAGPTSIELFGSWDEGDAKVEDFYFVYKGRRIGEGGEKYVRIDGLDPKTTCTIRFWVEGDSWDDASEIQSITTTELTLKTQAADAVSNNCAIIKAATNITDGADGTGFEWRRYDAPPTMPSTVVMCPAYNGYLAGKLNGLSANTYYNFRPFYKSESGNIYYGNWITFITADAYVYFDPIVYTYKPHVADDHIELLGYVMAGSDKIQEQGFEYWLVSQPASLRRLAAPLNPDKILSTGEKMSARLDEFVSGGTYRFRTFVTTESGTTYGEEVEFEAPVVSGINAIETGNEEKYPEAYFDLYGRRYDKPVKGLNIILYNDGTTSKAVLK